MLTISYLDKTARGKIRAVGQVTRSGRSLYFSTGKLLTEDGHLLATAQGTLKRAKDGGGWPIWAPMSSRSSRRKVNSAGNWGQAGSETTVLFSMRLTATSGASRST